MGNESRAVNVYNDIEFHSRSNIFVALRFVFVGDDKYAEKLLRYG